MAEVVIAADDVKQLGTKLMRLQPELDRAERALLWAALAVAADAVSVEGGLGRTSLVREGDRDGEFKVVVDDSWSEDRELTADFPAQLARAFLPEQAPGDGEGPTGGNAMVKIGGDVSIAPKIGGEGDIAGKIR